MLLHVSTLQRGRSDIDERALPELYLPRLDAHVFLEGVPVCQAYRPRLSDREAARPVLPYHHLPRT